MSAIFPLMPRQPGIRTENRLLERQHRAQQRLGKLVELPAPGPAAWPRAGAGSSVDAELVIRFIHGHDPRQDATLTPRWPDSVSVPYTASVRFEQSARNP